MEPKQKKKRKSGIPTGNSGEYYVMAELLRRGFDAQLADRNTKGYDLLVGRPSDPALRKVQVKTVRVPGWYVRVSDFKDRSDQTTIYVLIGPEGSTRPVRYFVAKNRLLADSLYHVPSWKDGTALMNIKPLEPHEDKWEALLK